MKCKKRNDIIKDIHSKKFPLSLSQTILFTIIDWDEFWRQELKPYSPKWLHRTGQIKRYPNSFMIMKAGLADKIKKGVDIKKLHSLFEILERKINEWSEILISYEDLRMILTKGNNISLNNLKLIEIGGNAKFKIMISNSFLDGEEFFSITQATRDTLLKNTPFLEGKIDGTDISTVGGRAWAIANQSHRNKYIHLFDVFKNEYKKKFPNQKYHKNQQKWVNKNPLDYISSDVPICSSSQNDMDINETILFNGDPNTTPLNLPTICFTENIEGISSKGYAPVWSGVELPTFNEKFISEDEYFNCTYDKSSNDVLYTSCNDVLLSDSLEEE
ncbi:40878_t:CDS:1 [Gigaspora margarita]|uniref:40878_t:CDS:1 n=1 Tax=Gigaspora margarita TaxID=4874 RepID=A0ABM8VZ56_GIGMA|nr:40878_t:CDS:1 [Gigaspora margarita]